MFASQKQIAKFLGVFETGRKLTYRKGEYIIRPGEAPSGVFYIEKGLVKAFNISKYGEENLLIIRKDQEIFPLIWAIIGEERHIIYQTLSPAVIWRVDHKVFEDFMHQHPSAMPPLLDMVTEMYKRHSERILNLEYRTVRERLVSFLLHMSSRFGEPVKDGLRLEVPLIHQDIASSISSSRETTSRELAVLERKGLISTSSSFITLKDIGKLRDYLGDGQ